MGGVNGGKMEKLTDEEYDAEEIELLVEKLEEILRLCDLRRANQAAKQAIDMKKSDEEPPPPLSTLKKIPAEKPWKNFWIKIRE